MTKQHDLHLKACFSYRISVIVLLKEWREVEDREFRLDNHAENFFDIFLLNRFCN